MLPVQRQESSAYRERLHSSLQGEKPTPTLQIRQAAETMSNISEIDVDHVWGVVEQTT